MKKFVAGLTEVGFFLFLIAISIVAISLFAKQSPGANLIFVPLIVAVLVALGFVVKDASKIGDRLKKIDQDLTDMEKIETESVRITANYRLTDDFTLVVEGKRLSNLKELMQVTGIISKDGMVATSPYLQDFFQPLFNFSAFKDTHNGAEALEVAVPNKANFKLSTTTSGDRDYLVIEQNGSTINYERWQCGALCQAAKTILRRYPPAPIEICEGKKQRKQSQTKKTATNQEKKLFRSH
jgi:hypothetical protein